MSRRDSLTPDVLDGAAPDNRVALFVAIDSERDAMFAVRHPRSLAAGVMADSYTTTSTTGKW